MVFSTEHQLDLPDEFPSGEMVAFMATARSVLLVPTKSIAWDELGGASNLIGWRYRTCHEDMCSYIESWEKFGSNVSFEEMYLRERSLFGMFTAGVSCIESTCYALHALGSHPKLLALVFGEREKRRCNPARLIACLATHPEARSLTSALDVLTKSNEWLLWVDLRNRMTHRSNLPRIIQASMGAELPPARALHFAATSSTPAFEADVAHLEALFTWLSRSLRSLLVEGLAFASGSTHSS